jgi:hypothetical protein
MPKAAKTRSTARSGRKSSQNPDKEQQENGDVGEMNVTSLATKVAEATVKALAPFLLRSSADQQPSPVSSSVPNSTPSTESTRLDNQQPLAGNSILDTPGVASHNLPQVPIVNAKMRKDILTGKYINLAALLSPNLSDQCGRELVLGEVSVALKSPDHRLNKNLTIQEFIQAFTIYRSVMCDVFPARRQELDTYMTTVINMHSQFPGYGFYEYHRQFTARAAQFLEQGIKVDWSIRDEFLFVTIFTGKRAQHCEICGNVGHSTSFCPVQSNTQSPARSSQAADTRGRKVVRFDGKQICNNYNGAVGCRNLPCSRLHLCLKCKKPHPIHQCAPQPSSK